MHRFGFNAARLRESGAARTSVVRAIERGVELFDIPGRYHPGCEVVRSVMAQRADWSKCRVVVKVGYFASSEGGVVHSLSPLRIVDEASRVAEEWLAAGARSVDVLCHNPEERGQDDARCSGELAAALRALADARLRGAPFGTLGVATNAPERCVLWTRVALDCGATLLRAPLCALQLEHLEALREAKEAGLEIFTHRPLLHVDAETRAPRRLVDDPAAVAPADYVAVCEAALKHFTPPPEVDDQETLDGCRWIQQLVADLNRNATRFASFEQWEHEITRQIVPMLHSKFDALDEDSATHLQRFFEAYGAAVRASAQNGTRALAATARPPLGDDEQMADWALRAVFDRPEPDRVLVAFASAADVDKTHDLLR